MRRRSRWVPALLQQWLGWIAITIVLLFVIVFGVRWYPHPPLQASIPSSTAILTQDGQLLRLTLSSDQQFRLWTPLKRISPALQEAVLLYEDRRFYWHPGVNLAAMFRSVIQTAQGNRQGGSTITMQLARRLYGLDTRNIRGKLKQIGLAMWLEALYSKHEIFEAYLNTAPYGGNIEGVAAASLIYFNKSADQITVPQALTLAVIPQNPRQRARAKGEDNQLLEARARINALWKAQHANSEATHNNDAAKPVQLRSTAQLPYRAPHFTDAVLEEVRRRTDLAPVQITTLNSAHQDVLERQLRIYLEQKLGQGIRNAAAILVDAKSREIRAYVGSADYFDETIDGQVNGLRARRSPGSTLKPFVYALGMDQGILHPMTVLKDASTAFGPFSPENFDGRFVGPITAQDALIRSRNVPAVSVASRIDNPGLYTFLKQTGVGLKHSEKHYGLALALGGGDASAEELAMLYAGLANEGEFAPLRFSKTSNSGQLNKPISAEAAWITLNMLRHNPRPDNELPAKPAVAWKTGTSWGFRDAWTAGVFDNMVLIVWLGNFDNESNPALVGVRTAAPLFFRVVDALRAQQLTQPTESSAPRNLKLRQIEVCAATGQLPNRDCPQKKLSWFIPGKSPITQSQLHRAVWVNPSNGATDCAEHAGWTRQVHEYWSSDMQRLFREAGMPRAKPPLLPPHCNQSSGARSDRDSGGLLITSPLQGTRYVLRASGQATPLQLAAITQTGHLYWFADQAFIGESIDGVAINWLPPKAGRFLIRVVDEQGLSDSRELIVEADN